MRSRDNLQRLSALLRCRFGSTLCPGGELLVLLSGARWLRHVRFLWMEVHPYTALSNELLKSLPTKRSVLEMMLSTLLDAGMTVLTIPNQRHPGFPKPTHEWLFLGCGASVTHERCVELCKTWRRGTQLRCSHVRRPDDFWGSPHMRSDCQLHPLGLSIHSAKASCLSSAADGSVTHSSGGIQE